MYSYKEINEMIHICINPRTTASGEHAWSKNFEKYFIGVDIKVHISQQKKFCKDMLIQFRFIMGL